MIQKEKSKGKAHPFTSMLDADEEIVWMSTPTQPSLWNIIKSKLWMYKVLFLFSIVAALVTALTQPYPTLRVSQWFLVLLAMTIIQTLWVGPVIVIQWLFRRYHRRDRFYAITNERVLYFIKGLKRSIPLKALPQIDLFSIDEGGRFGAYYPMWLNTEDMKTVRTLMAKAQKQADEEL